ncbi:la-related protein 6b [Chanos chanos]|uniref:La-related protein 6b n=1 Tax=Chanos chanos TaxID=29144 RepID=A0A6J2W6X8_CHACN|nr:la-related protein 6-like [Chanos chanos]
MIALQQHTSYSMSSPTSTDILLRTADRDSQYSLEHSFYTDYGLSDSLDGSSAELTDVFDEDCWVGEVSSPPVLNLCQKIAAQLENYLSDENLSDDAFLLKHVQRNKMGYVSLKLLTSFKKIRELTRDWRVTLAAAKTSPLLEVNEEGTKVRRKTPVPDWLLCIPTSKLLLAWNLHSSGSSSTEEEREGVTGQHSVMETAMQLFGRHGTITSLRILRPGKEIPTELRRYAKKHTELGRKVCAVVEYEYLEGARRAFEALRTEETQGGRAGIRVALLGSRGTRKPRSSQDDPEELSEIGLENSSPKKPNRKARHFLYSLEDSALYSSSESDFAPASPRPNRRVSRPQSLYGSPLTIPRVSTLHQDPYRNPLGSPVGSPLLPRKLLPTGHGSSPLATPQLSSSPTFSRRQCSGDFSTQESSTFVGSPWVQRRRRAAKAVQSEKCHPATQGHAKGSAGMFVARQPLGPDGTRGFHNCIGRGRVLLQ